MKLSKYLGVCVYAILLILAILFYKERTIFMDASFICFSVIKDGALAIQDFRFGSAITQIFPLISSQLGLPLQAVLLSYSIGFIIFYATIYCVIKYWFKNEMLSLVLLLFNLLMVSQTFYWIQSEQIQGTALLLFYFALQFKNPIEYRYPEINISISYLLLFTVAFIHPILVVQFIFISLFLFFSNKDNSEFRRKNQIISRVFFYIFILAIKMVFFKNQYDSGAINNMKNFISLFPNYISIASNKNFIYYLITDYYLAAILLVLISVYYYRKAEWIKLSLMNIFFFGFLLIVNVSYKDGADKFYIESHYLSLSIFIIIPFVFDYLPTLEMKKVHYLISSIILIRLVYIFFNHIPFTDRLNWEREFLMKNDHKKIIKWDNNVPKDTLFMTWATPYEFWLLSTIEKKETRSIVFLDHENELDWALSKNKSFVTKWGVFDYNQLPKKYFILNDTTPYIKIK